MGMDSGCLLTFETAGPCSSYMLPGKTTTFNQQNAQSCSLDVYIIVSRLIFVYVSVRKEPSSGNQT